MRSYAAHLRAERPPVLRREGWSWGAFLFGPLWLVAQLAWIPAVVEAAAIVAVLAAAPSAAVPVLVGLAVLNGLTGQDAVGWSLERRGWRLAHVVVAPDRDAALLRLLTARPELLR